MLWWFLCRRPRSRKPGFEANSSENAEEGKGVPDPSYILLHLCKSINTMILGVRIYSERRRGGRYPFIIPGGETLRFGPGLLQSPFLSYATTNTFPHNASQSHLLGFPSTHDPVVAHSTIGRTSERHRYTTEVKHYDGDRPGGADISDVASLQTTAAPQTSSIPQPARPPNPNHLAAVTLS